MLNGLMYIHTTPKLFVDILYTVRFRFIPNAISIFHSILFSFQSGIPPKPICDNTLVMCPTGVYCLLDIFGPIIVTYNTHTYTYIYRKQLYANLDMFAHAYFAKHQ